MSGVDAQQAGVEGHLSGRRLPRWSTPALAGGALLVGLLVQLTGWTVVGLAPGVVAAIVFLLGQAITSLAIEGRRHSKDRIATTLIYATFVVALTPLLWILITVLVKGLSVFDWTFFTSTMRNVSPRQPGGGILHAFLGT